MARDLPAPLVAAVEAPVVRPFLAVFIDTPDPVAAFTGRGTITFEGRDWIGIGGIGSFDMITEDTDGSASGVSATLNAVPSEFRDDVADQAVRGCAYELWIGAFNETYQTVESHKLIWKGRLDGYEIIDGGETLTVTATGESRQRDQRRPTIKRCTDEYQQRLYPGDRFFEYVSKMPEIPVLWAKAKQDPI
jgi:hypothetical protein